ncbi:MAG: NADPH-dependent FMN reductase [Bryobacteraceae bacterium]
MVRILAISGSLRHASSNSTLLRAVAALAPAHISVEIYTGLGELPHFNPDLEDSEPPSVLDLRSRVANAHAVLICSPEYAHGVPGVLKNALDWLVGSGEFADKPVGLLNAAPRATHAQESLAETLRTMAARIIPEASITLAIQGAKLDERAIVEHVEFAPRLRAALEALASSSNL